MEQTGSKKDSNAVFADEFREMENELYRVKDNENSGWAIVGRILKPKEFFVAWGGGGGAVEYFRYNEPVRAVAWCIGAYITNLIWNGAEELYKYYQERKLMKETMSRN